MTTTPPAQPSEQLSPTAQRLLDAQVAWLIARVSGDELESSIRRETDELLEIGSRITFAELVDAEAVKAAARDLFTLVPASTAASTLVEMAADVAHEGPGRPFTLADVLDRENVERIADEVLGSADLVGTVLDDLTRSPLVAGLASRFVTKIVTDVMASNRAMAEKIPGVGGLVGFGAGAAGKMAGKVVGAADKQLEAVLGDTAAKGAAFAMRRLNRIIVEILKDPTTRSAVLEVFDLYAVQEVPPLSDTFERDDVHRVAALLQDIVIAGAPTAPVLAVLDALVDGFFDCYGEHPVTTLVTDLGLERDVLVEHGLAFGRRGVAAVLASGDLERVLRARLTEFYASPEVASILA